VRRFLATFAITLAFVLAVLSLSLNAFLLYSLLQARQAGLEAVAEARAALATLNDRTIEAQVPIHHAVPVQATLPVRQDFAIPVQTTLPISTVVTVPLDLPLVGRYEIAVPVQAEIPLDLEVVVPVSQTVSLETTVQLDTEVPVRIEVQRLGLEDLLGQLDAALAQVEQALRGPLSPGPSQ